MAEVTPVANKTRTTKQTAPSFDMPDWSPALTCAGLFMMGDGTEEQNLARMQSCEVQRVIIDRAWASLANRSSFKGAVFRE